MSTTKQLQDLDKLIKHVREQKTAAIKTASPGDGVEDGTKKPETGAQLASNKEEAGKGTKAMVDGGAKANATGASVEASTEGATAVATSGKKGTDGADLKVVAQAPNGPEGGIKSAGVISSADAKSIADSLRKVAGEMSAPTETKTEAKIATAKESEVNEAAAGSSFACFLVRAALANPSLKTAAEGMGQEQLGGGIAQALLQKIQSGEVSEQDAEKMLMEAAQSGAIKPEDVQAAMQAMQATGGAAGAGAPPAAPAPGSDPAAAAGGAGPGAIPAPAPGAGAPPAGGEMVQDPGLEAKMASIEVGPSHPLYTAKLAQLYESDMRAGYAFGVKLADEMAPPEAGAVPPSAPADAGMPAAGAPPAAAPGDDAAALTPQNPEQLQALSQVLQQMGITPEELKALLEHGGAQSGAPATPPADPAQAKMAAYRISARTALFHKLAAYHESLQLTETK